MFTHLLDRSVFVYHYTSAKTAAELILPHRRLRLGSYAQTNDPKETKEWVFAIGGLGPQDDYVSVEDVSAQVSRAIKSRAHVLCASLDVRSIDSLAPEVHSRGFARPRMWDQYGHRHTGVCLVFHREHLSKLIEEQFPDALVLGKAITYKNRPFANSLSADDPYLINYPHLLKVGLEQYARDHIVTHGDHIFFEKAEDWRDEHEFRWLVATYSPRETFLLFDRALVGIVFGQDCEEGQVRTCVRLARAGGTQFEQIKWRNSAPWLSFRLDWKDI